MREAATAPGENRLELVLLTGRNCSLQSPHWSKGEAWGGRSGKKEMHTLTPGSHSPSPWARGMGNVGAKLGLAKGVGRTVLVLVSHHPNLL